MTPRPTSNYDLLTDLEANIAHAAWIASVIDDWEGPTSTSGGRGQKGAHADPTEAAVLHGYRLDDPDHPDQSTGAWADTADHRLVAAAHAQLDDLAELRRIASRMNARRHGTLNRMSLDQAKTSVNERTTPSTVGFCEACPTYCTAATKYESLIGKLCGACRQAFDRWPKSADRAADRVAFIIKRREQTRAEVRQVRHA